MNGQIRKNRFFLWGRVTLLGSEKNIISKTFVESLAETENEWSKHLETWWQSKSLIKLSITLPGLTKRIRNPALFCGMARAVEGQKMMTSEFLSNSDGLSLSCGCNHWKSFALGLFPHPNWPYRHSPSDAGGEWATGISRNEPASNSHYSFSTRKGNFHCEMENHHHHSSIISLRVSPSDRLHHHIVIVTINTIGKFRLITQKTILFYEFPHFYSFLFFFWYSDE